MKKAFLIISIFAASVVAQAQDDTPYYKYRVQLTDKKDNEYSLKHPEAFLSEKSLERRRRQGIKVDFTDLPVTRKYIDGIAAKGVDVWLTSKWNNTVVVGCSDTTLMAGVNDLSFVESVRKIATYKSKPTKGNPRRAQLRNSEGNILSNGSTYGHAYEQISMLNGVAMHGAGFRGQGITIAITDGGFHNADVIPALKNVKVLGAKDFVGNTADVYAEDVHGMNVLSCMGTNVPGLAIGTAPEAEYWLLRTEDSYSEQMVEEDNWVAAAEFADSVGVDIINSSLGYITFDTKADNVQYSELDGRTHINSRSASMLASKGMILCNSAGNSGNDKWQKIGTPADASDILAVGAVDRKRVKTSFSSLGHSADGRVKPDVAAMGAASAVIAPTGMPSAASGTSFSSPILCGMVACLWQALPHLNAYQIMDLIRHSGDRADDPDNAYGYGIPDLFKAYYRGLIMK